MSHFFTIHPDDPQERLIAQAMEIVSKGGVIAYPTDSGYALGCRMGDKTALDRIRAIRRIDDKHHMTLICQDLSELSLYARVDNTAFRMIKNNTPGAYTFILEASKEVPKRLMHPKKKTIGLRIPATPIIQAMLGALREPLLSSSLILPGEADPMVDPYDIRDTLEHALDVVIDGGYCGVEPTTIVSFLGEMPEIIRQGSGDASPFLF